MPRKRTREELEREIERLRPYEELASIQLHSRSVHRVASGEHVFRLEGAGRASGGVILSPDNALLGFAVDVCIRWNASGDPYLRDCASQVHRFQKEAIERRSQRER